MSEEIVLPSLDDAAKQRMEEALRRRMEKQGHVTFSDIKGKEPEEESLPEPESQTMKKLRMISQQRESMALNALNQIKQASAPIPQEEAGLPPCIKMALGIGLTLIVAYYLGNKTYKYWKSSSIPDPE